MDLTPTLLQNTPTNQLTGIITNEIYQTYFTYGPGLFERVYEATLEGRLRNRGLRVLRQHPIRITNQYVRGEPAYIADLIVEDTVLIELKSVEQLHKLHYKQLRTYLKLAELPVGLLVNFNTNFLKDNIRRIVNDLEE